MDLKIANSDRDGTLVQSLSSVFVDGTDALTQQLWIELVSDYSSLLNRGSGLRKVVEEADPTNQRKLLSDVARCFNVAKTHLLEQQRAVGSISAAGRLQDLVLNSVRVLESNPVRIEMRVTLVTAGGTATQQLVL